jgi:LysM repeat protein
MTPRRRRSPARFLAPLALIAVMVALLAIVSAANNKGSTDSKASTSSQTTQATGSSTTASGSGKAKPKVTRRRIYIVKVGDNLSTIAVKTGVSVDVLQELNPNVDPHAMTAGQKIRLK